MAKIKVREYVPVRPARDSTGLSVGFTDSIRQINRLGTTLTGIGRSIGQIHGLHEFSEEWLDSTGERRTRKIRHQNKQSHKRWLEGRRVDEKLKNKKQDQEAEDLQEKDVDDENVVDESKLKEKVKKEKGGALKGILGFFKTIGNLLVPFIAQLGALAALDWVSKNPDKVQTVLDFLVGWGKFGYKILSFGIDKFMDGVATLTGTTDPNKSVMERVFDGVKGIGQLVLGLGGLWAASRVFMPWKLINDTRRFVQLWDIFNGESEDQQDQQQRGRNQRPSRRQRTANASKAARQRYARRYGGDAARRRFQGNVKGRGPLNKVRATANKINRGAKNFSNGLKKLSGKLGRMKGLTKGLTRIAGPAMAVLSGVNAYQDALAEGKTNTEAVGRGVGAAAGGVLGAVIGTALLGPFLGPFAPIVGGLIGDWLGKWAGEKLAPLVEKAFKKVFEFLKKAKRFIKDTIKKVLDIQLKFIKPFLDFTFTWIDLLADVVDGINKFNEFILNAVLDGVIDTIRNIINGAEFLAEKAGAVWNFVTGLFRAEGGPVSNKNQVQREVHQRKRTEPKKMPKKASGGKIQAWYTTGPGGASKKLPMGKEITYGMLYQHHSQPTTFRSYGSHKIGYPKDYNFSNTKSGDPWPSSGRDVGIPTPLPAEVVYKDPTSRSGGYGNTVVLKTKQGFMQYSHLHSFGNFRPGSKIPAGTIVGGQGDTGTPGSWHLHMNAPKRLHEVFSNYISMGKPVSGSTGNTPSQEEDGSESQSVDGAEVAAAPQYSLSDIFQGGIIGNDPMSAGAEEEYFGSLQAAVGAIKGTDNQSINKVGSLSAFSSQQAMNRALAPGGSTIMIQQIRSAANGETQSVIVSQPNPSPLINKC